MKPAIRVVATPALRRKYLQLLESDWSRKTIPEALRLLWKEIAASEGLALLPFLEALKPNRTGVSTFNAGVVEEIRGFRRHFEGNGLIPAVPPELPQRRSKRSWADAESTWTFLTLANLARVEGDKGLFADSQSLLFLLAIDFLLPTLDAGDDAAVKDCLINALYMHTFVTWSQDPQRQAHHFFLQGILMDYLKHPQLSRDNLLSALQLTPLEDHSYLTKVQAYVFSLLDSGKNAEAKRFLLGLYRRAPDAYLSELGEMIDQVQNHCVTSDGR